MFLIFESVVHVCYRQATLSPVKAWRSWDQTLGKHVENCWDPPGVSRSQR